MKSLFRSLWLLIAITCLVWVAVMWHWQATHRDMSSTDIVMFLGLLPIALFALVVAGRWALTGVDERAARRAASKASTSAAPAGTTKAATSAGEAERRATMHLLWSGVRCAAGATPGELAAAIGQRRPDLDRELVDDDGLPVLAARIDGLAPDGASPPLGMVEQLARRRAAIVAEAPVSPTLPRALAAMSACLDDLFAALAPWRAALGGDDTLSTTSGQATPAEAPPPARLLVYAAWPDELSAFDLALADLWLQRAMDERREGIVGAGRIVRPPAEPSSVGPALLLRADEAMARMRRESITTDLVLLLACESHVVDTRVQRWQRDGLLCSSRHPKGRVPGEGAAALLLAPVAWPTDDAAPGVVVHRPAIVERDKSVDAADRAEGKPSSRVDASAAAHAIEQALAAAGVAPPDIATLATDADQATLRCLEVHAAMHARLPHLDAADEVSMAGTATGYIGCASTLAAVALAAHHAREDNGPCIALSVGHPVARAAVAVRRVEPAAGPTTKATTTDRVA